VGLEITALRVGCLRNFPQAAMTLLRRWDERVDLPMIMFAITGGHHPIIVDTGTSDPERALREHGYDLHRPTEEEPLNALQSAGIDPAEVRTVILTHLHWDHCSNNHLFPNATFVVQRSELPYAIDPAEPQRVTYESGNGLVPPWISSIGRFTVVDGDADVAPGVAVIHVPGHSPGSQGVLVQTDGGPYFIAGDCVGTYDNWHGDAGSSHIPSGAYTDLVQFMESFRKIESTSAEVIPSHDQAVVDRRHFG
jgi:glyoxylase-like metal-dependent hydrolase (beta-lactamase superfamily II)